MVASFFRSKLSGSNKTRSIIVGSDPVHNLLDGEMITPQKQDEAAQEDKRKRTCDAADDQPPQFIIGE